MGALGPELAQGHLRTSIRDDLEAIEIDLMGAVGAAACDHDEGAGELADDSNLYF
ncbi:MAG: hypothetical protein OXI46_05890 [Gemmatimonadota bacterium]|nr:hypothetical protein [Gemmatimonadota bacterium]